VLILATRRSNVNAEAPHIEVSLECVHMKA
jgi:hypothetical protein